MIFLRICNRYKELIMLLDEAKQILNKNGYIIESDEQVSSRDKLLTLADYAEELSHQLYAYYQGKFDNDEDFNVNNTIEYYVNKINEIKNSL